MFGFAPKLPVSPEIREWTDQSLERLSVIFQQLTQENIQVVLPTDEYFPDRWDGTEPDWRGSSSGVAGLYREVDETGHISIAIKHNQLANLTSLIATLAHELGHVLLLADAKISHDAKDMEPLTDLVTIFWGMGIFTANSAVNFKQYSNGNKQGWSIKRQGYLLEPMLGYALARFAMDRQERNPKWASHLTLNVRTYFNQSLKFLVREARA